MYDPIGFTIEVLNNKDLTHFLFESKIITLDEKDRILELISSPDKENYTVAKLILKNKADGINIHTKKVT